VDAVIIEAPVLDQECEKGATQRGYQTKKGEDWHFWMKADVGTDKRGIVHSPTTTPHVPCDVSSSRQSVQSLVSAKAVNSRTVSLASPR
jgi:hypothetical protein